MSRQLPIPVLGIPYYNRADLLYRLLGCIDYPIQKLVVIDNSNGKSVRIRGISQELQIGEVVATALVDYVESIEVIRHPNAGVAASWNEIIKLFPAPWWLISNDDMAYHPGDLEKMARFVNANVEYRMPGGLPDNEVAPAGIVYGNHGASWFGITKHGVNTVGLFDENIYPAYLEDCDWSYRADLLGVRRCDVPNVHAIHGENGQGSRTVNFTPELAVKNARTHGGNFNYYRRKWGGLNGTEVFKTPFNDPNWPVWAWRFETETRKQQQW